MSRIQWLDTIGASNVTDAGAYVSERSPFPQSTEQTVWQGSPSQVVNLPTYMTLGIGVIVATLDLAQAKKHRAAFGFFRDRRPELYGRLVEDR